MALFLPTFATNQMPDRTGARLCTKISHGTLLVTRGGISFGRYLKEKTYLENPIEIHYTWKCLLGTSLFVPKSFLWKMNTLYKQGFCELTCD